VGSRGEEEEDEEKRARLPTSLDFSTNYGWNSVFSLSESL
jgi:hypothetical protein